MRGLPPVPNGVLELELVFRLARPEELTHIRVGRVYTTTLRYLAPGLNLLERDRLIALLGDVAFAGADLAVKCTTQSAWHAEYRFRFHDVDAWDYRIPAADINGAWSGDAFANVACGIYWRDGRGGRHGHAISYFPTFPRTFTDDGATINSNGWLTVRDAALHYLDAIAALGVEYATTLTPVLLRRAQFGAPLPRAVVTPIESALPCEAVADMGRRRARHPRVTAS